MTQDMSERSPTWPHAPTHRLSEAGTYFVTSGTYLKEHFFREQKRLEVLQRGLLKCAAEFGWRLEAWAVFSNHYHFIGHSPEEGAKSLETFLRTFHTKMARWINGLDRSINRQVWHNYWETRLTYPNSYLARLNYVHQNAVKHGLVAVAREYPWCSAGWFERTATLAQVKSIYRFKIDQVRVLDEYEVDPNW
jgi:putative transposase